jgi:hypothetical protein
MNLIEIFSIIMIHWIADFVFQDEKWALGKSENTFDLTAHTVTYSMLWYLPMCIMLNSFLIPLIFVLITFITHTITDYFTSRIVSKKFKNGQYGSAIPNFGAFTIIGIDQVLHYIQLFTTYWLLK